MTETTTRTYVAKQIVHEQNDGSARALNKTLYISQPFSAIQPREITIFCVFKTTRVPIEKSSLSSHIQLKVILMQLLNTFSHSRNV